MLYTKKEIVRINQLFFSIWTLAWPAIIEFGLQTLVQYVDLFMVGRLGVKATATVGVAAQVHFLIKFPLASMSVGVLAYISKAVGENNWSNVKKASMQAVFLTAFVGIVGTALSMSISSSLPCLLKVDNTIRQDFIEYFRISYATLGLFTASCVFASVLRAVGNMKTPMIVNGLINILNLILNVVFIYPSTSIHIGKVSIPWIGLNMGLHGSALATSISIGAGGILMFIEVYRNEKLTIKNVPVSLDFDIIKRFVSVSIPAVACSLVNGFGRIIFTSYVAAMGTNATAAHSIAFSVEGFFYIPAIGFQRAVTTLAGNYLGEKNQYKLISTTKAAVLMGFFIAFTLGSVLFLFADRCTLVFTNNAEVVSLSSELLRIVAFSEPIFALSLIMEGIFQGLGSTKITFLISSISMWFFRVYLCYLLTQQLHLGLWSVWLCMVIDNICRGMLLTLRFANKRWQKLF